ncbi:class I SAM-dependent methyltransferase [Microbacterium schleiferi]|uniref:class I SAM-dependent methyltransferase n=1 Tax=Microbacterium schleiferi TaxID=69362 RepID=UPI000E940FC7|nr:class I SAM-dependent methyltransferase [Microbacterium schleiferi]MEC8762794.1 class I SAM-dependent methyltransferase [Actinomycetota bacterium]HAJ17365.1 SAM-dependent methyltransferase [Microbacterium sp.]MCC4266307.1 class I SAM-dependent methyltransferase [Microbacterium schleiferi]HBU43767.1 SAM-dependent methyltransferase [Microbacterium sp.]HCM50450.1 SAM-dependent methyltransferase [Microbacterium sp.]
MPSAPSAPTGRPTRGTTGTNRLRRVDRWIARHPVLRRASDPLIVDLGYGATGITTLELAARLSPVRPDIDVLGLEIDPERVERAREQLRAVRAGLTTFDPDTRVSFARAGFEVPAPRRPTLIRALNVLRQYDDVDVEPAWSRMAGRLAPDGLLVEGTCDEIGRVMTWVVVGSDAAPRSLTVSLRLAGLESPAIAAERLPKALIHRNVPGEPIHAFFLDLTREWERAAPLSTFSPAQRWKASLQAMHDAGWPLIGRHRWRLGEVTVPWASVAPR